MEVTFSSIVNGGYAMIDFLGKELTAPSRFSLGATVCLKVIVRLEEPWQSLYYV
ncbi:MAG: hypothetical protein JSV96_17045 [Candidatus Aminicenantes bacterium]|nr:MAG: hypothetical protein JSV96_17045 [Candidatus Aminicenantes bacterium]